MTMSPSPVLPAQGRPRGPGRLPRVAAKLTRYRQLADRTAITTPVLFWLPGTRRETALHARLTASRDPRGQVPVATAAPDLAGGDGPAGPVWLPIGQAGPRCRLAQLAAAWPDPAAAQPPARDSEGPGQPVSKNLAHGLPWHPPAPMPPPAPRYRGSSPSR